MAPSRIKDDFRLELRLDKPNQREEDAIRDFVVWLRQIPVPEFGLSTPMGQFLDGIRAAASTWFTSPPASSPPADFMFGSPPSSFHIQSMDLCKYMAAAFRLWVTELRPKWIARWQGCAAQHFEGDKATDEDCVLLAQLNVPVEPKSPGPWSVPDAEIEVSDSGRPYLLHLRMLQDWVTCGVRQQAANELKVRALKAGVGGSVFHVAAADECLVCDSQDGTLEVDLPPANLYPGRVIVIKKLIGSKAIAIKPAGSDLIDGQSPWKFSALSKFASLQIVAGTKTDWLVISTV